MTDTEIVPLGPDDWRVFREVRLRSLAEAPAAFGSRHDDWVDAPESAWRHRLTAVPLTVVARRAETVVGVASGYRDGAEVELISMWADPAVRGTGVAGSLVDAVVRWAAEQGCPTYLMVRSDNPRAIAAYEKAGFVDRGVPEGWPRDEPPENRMDHRLESRPDRGGDD